jgi:hypothetical protein
MKNRILKRPMFKMGGSTDGIMSGLDTPSLDASRATYNRGGDVRKRVDTIRGIYDDVLPERDRRGMPGSVSNLLTGFGLNLLAQPGGQNIFQTAAKAAQTPYQQFVAARRGEQAEDRALTQAIIGDAIEQESDEEIARLKGEKGKSYEFEKKLGAYEGFQTAISNNLEKINSIDEEIKQKQKELATIEAGEKGEIDTVKVDFINKTIKQLEKEGKDLASSNKKIKRRSEIVLGNESDLDRQVRLEREEGNITVAEYNEYLRTGKLPESLGKAEGGRIGYQEGDMVDTPSLSRASAIDYNTLRSRLPKEIGNDIVKLISDSNKALTDFANIRTQQDVDQFNQAYNVNLVLPAEE